MNTPKYVEALRGQIRWGVGSVDAMFEGFKALPGAGDSIVTPAPMSIEDAADLIVSIVKDGHALSTASLKQSAAEVLKMPWRFTDLYRLAVKKLHPDTNGGAMTPEWLRLQRAADALKRHHNIS